MPLHTPTVSVPTLPRLGHLVALAAAALATAGATVVIADDQPTPQVRTIETVATRYFDLEANKAASMRALSRHIAQQPVNSVSRYQDLEANKAGSQRLR